MLTQEIVYGRTGQVVEFYPPESARDLLGVPSSVTYEVFDGNRSNDDDPEFEGNATVDSVSTTLSTAAGFSVSPRNRIVVASSTGIVAGRPYLLDSTLSQREVVEPKKINSTTIDLVSDLQYEYAQTVSTLKGIRCTFTVDATWVTDESNILLPAQASYRVRWQYTVNATVYNYQTYLRLVRKAFKSTVTAQDLIDHWPDLLKGEPLSQRGEGFRRIIDAAEEIVRTDILAEGYKPEQIHDTEILDRLVRLAAFYQIAQFHKSASGIDRESFIERNRAEYANLFSKTIATLRVGLDTGVEGTTNERPVQRYFFSR